MSNISNTQRHARMAQLCQRLKSSGISEEQFEEMCKENVKQKVMAGEMKMMDAIIDVRACLQVFRRA